MRKFQNPYDDIKRDHSFFDGMARSEIIRILAAHEQDQTEDKFFTENLPDYIRGNDIYKFILINDLGLV